MSPNMYEHLNNLDHLDDAVITGTNNERRKAEKKLKEIQILLKKTSHTKEELDKLATEQHWKDIIDWIDNPKKTEETQKTIKNRLKRKREKEKRERELEEIRKRREKEAEEQKRRHEEIRKQREKEAEEQKRRYQEDRKQKRQEEEEFRKRQEEEFREHQDLWSEFDAMYRQNNDVNKTFRKLSVKYHPDKNIGKKQWSEAKQQELTNIRDHYSIE